MAVHFKTFSNLEEIDRKIWNRLAEGASPMMEWEYFRALERSGSVSTAKGYRASHLAAFLGEDQQPIAIAPLYERDRAWVEFGDGGLIELLGELTGIPFQHGLVGSIPFTPVPGYQFIHRPEIDSEAVCSLVLNHIDLLCEKRGLYTSRIYFVAPAAFQMHSVLQQHGYVALRSHHLLWFNRGYKSFEDYLSSFKSSRRTKIKRELRTIREHEIEIRMVAGIDAPHSFYDMIHSLYVNTWVKHMGYGINPFLNASFFNSLSEDFRHRTLFSVASKGDDILGMALFYHKQDCIYGRYWGSSTEYPFLHFATCYYQPIEYAIRKGIGTMDPGFGGEHKLIRGYEVVPVYHYIKFHGERPRRIAHSILHQIGV
ncbi:MAG: GNAT family N-acetyltransferase [Syntrophobacteraceae bacterium]